MKKKFIFLGMVFSFVLDSCQLLPWKITFRKPGKESSTKMEESSQSISASGEESSKEDIEKMTSFETITSNTESTSETESISESESTSETESPSESTSDTSSIELEGMIVEEKKYDDLQFYFMELGVYNTGDSTYIKAGDMDILIDAGAKSGSAVTIEKFVDQYCTDGILEYVITTHSHEDHYSGMFGNSNGKNFKGESVARTGIMYYYQIDTIIDFAYTTQEDGATMYTNYKNAVNYAVSNGAVHYTAAECFLNSNGAKSHYVLDEENNITMDILYNKFYFEKSSDENNHSVCTLFNYNDHHFLLTGDLEKAGEEALALYYDGSTLEKTLPHCDLFKAGHHGSYTASNDCLLSKITPDICCVCCCAGGSEYTKASANTFPSQDFINRIAKYTDRVYVTSKYNEEESRKQNKNVFESFNGTICVSSDGKNVGLEASNNLVKLKDSEWFNETVYLKSDGSICSGLKKRDFFTKETADVLATTRRIWPTYE